MRLLGHPFFQRYGVNLPSSLTEGHSFTWGDFPLPTGVGLRYGQTQNLLAAFLGGLGADDFRWIAPTRPRGHAHRDRDFPRSRTSAWKPTLSIRWAHLPYRVPASLKCLASGAGLSHLLAIAYDSNVLGLGPD
jgi:hypothetical protein